MQLKLFNIRCLLALNALCGFAWQSCQAKTDHPNIVMILADDCTFRDIGCYGGQALTPSIDKLATEGMKFERCFQTAPMCSPTRHNIFTGLYPVKSGAYPNHTMIYPDVKTVAHYLQPIGYHVALIGKQHIGPKKNFPWKYLGGLKGLELGAIDTYLEKRAKDNQPFSLFVCSNSPHGPWDQGDPSVYPPEKIELPPYIVDTPLVRHNFAKYLAEVTHFDTQVGMILDMLEKHGQTESTLVVVLSEQGNSYPFAKWTCYDHGLQSAMIVRWPEVVKPGSVSHAMVEYVDLLPTFIDAAGCESVEGIDGRSFLPVLEQKTDHHKDFVYGLMTTRGIHSGSEAYGIRSIRGERFKLIVNLNHDQEFKNILMKSGDYKSMIEKAESGDATAKKLVHAYSFRPSVELYDLDNDPLEMNNVADKPEHADTITDLRERLDTWMVEQGDFGVLTEKAAKLRQGKHAKHNRRLSREEVIAELAAASEESGS